MLLLCKTLLIYLLYKEGIMTVIGCGREGCASCASRRKTVLERGGRYIDLRPSGAMQTFGPGNTLTVTQRGRLGLDKSIQLLDPEFCRGDVCNSCRRIDFQRLLTEDNAEHALFSNHSQLERSAATCALCALIASTLVDPFSFLSDDSRPVSLRGATATSVEVVFPSKEEGYEEVVCERVATLQVYAANECKSCFEIAGM
jgi:hypothetical protein